MFYLDDVVNRREAGIPGLDFSNEDEESRRRRVDIIIIFIIFYSIVFFLIGTLC